MALHTGKTAIVTGSGQGVGQGIALALAADGCNITVCGRTASKLEATKAMLEELGVKAICVAGDVTNPDDLARIVDESMAAFGRIDILVNNAQIVPRGTLHQLTDEAMEAGWQSGPMAVLRLGRLCHPHLKETKGCIVNLSSSATKRWDMSGYGGYAAVKQAIVMLTRAAACEWGPDGIRTNAVLPHAKSPGLVGWMANNPKEAEIFQSTIPQRRVGELDEIGRFVSQLCGENASYVNGQSIAIDGGQANLN